MKQKSMLLGVAIRIKIAINSKSEYYLQDKRMVPGPSLDIDQESDVNF